uniref:Keratin n=1 Tax=Chelonoidis abingdonii TaxID=106734 RepID=A0A8C0JD94_CHEAB
MSFRRDLCKYPAYPSCNVTCPQPFVDVCNQPCVTSCGDSSVVVYPPPVVVRFPGPILATCPQESIVGSSEPLGIGSSLGYQGSYLSGSSYGYKGSLGLCGSMTLYNDRKSYTPGLSLGRGCSDPCSSRWLNMYGCGPRQTQQE